MREGSKSSVALRSSAPPFLALASPYLRDLPSVPTPLQEGAFLTPQPLLASLCLPGWGTWEGKVKGQGPGSEGVKFGQQPARLDFLLVLGATGGGRDALYWCFSCWDGAAFMSHSPRVIPTSLGDDNPIREPHGQQ